MNRQEKAMSHSLTQMIDELVDEMDTWSRDDLLEWAQSVRYEMLDHVDYATVEDEYYQMIDSKEAKARGLT